MDIDPKSIDRAQIVVAVERFLANRSPAPKVERQEAQSVTDFVCEDDVRKAIAQSKKIFIGPKTIVTPSARDLAGTHDVLILTKK